MNHTYASPAWSRRLATTVLVLFATQVAPAQSPVLRAKDPADTTPVVLETIQVTGSLLPKVAGETFVPLSSYSDLKLLQLGAATPIEGLRSLPSFFGATTTELDSNGGAGNATVNLRGLGGTLTLINGRRAGSTGTSGFTDLNVIPIDAIQSIDILKDGAGSVYGADALAGVVNVVLKQKWNGSQLRTGYGISDKGDAQQWDASFLYSQTFAGNKGYLTAVGSYADKETLYARDRSLSANADGRRFGGVNGGSPTFAGHIGSAGGGILLNPSLDYGRTPDDYRPFVPSEDSFNFREYSPSIPGQTRKLFHFAAGYELAGRQVEPYVEFDWADQYTANGIAPAPFALPNETARNSRYNPWGVGEMIPGNTVRYRGNDVGNRLSEYDQKELRAVIGVKGSLANGWGYDAAFLKVDEKVMLTEKNGILRSRLEAETDAGRFNPFARAGSSGTYRDSAWDNFASLTATLATGRKPTTNKLESADLKLFGPAIELPGGTSNVAVGYERRKTHDTYSPEAIYFDGDLLGFNSGNPFDASSRNNALFGEWFMPLVGAGNRVPLIREISLTTNVRYDNATVRDNLTGEGRRFGSDTHRFGLRYQPVNDLVLRASYGTGFRVPPLSTLYAAPGSNFPTLIDPLNFPIGQQTQVGTRGNPDLNPETSVSRGLGLVFSPRSIPGLNITVDYYRTKLNGLISNGAQYILNQNAATQGAGYPLITRDASGDITSVVVDPDALYADRIFRDPVTGQLDDSSGDALDTTNLNVAERVAEGIDYTFSYRQRENALGRFTHTLEFNQVLAWDLLPEPGSPVQDFVGKFVDPASNAIAPGSIPEWKGYYNLLWERNAWSVSLTMNYIHEVLDDPNAQYTDANGHFAYVDADGQDVPTDDISMERHVTFDLTVTYAFQSGNPWLRGTEIRLGVQNIGDEPPPFSAGAFNDNYDTSLYHIRGRFFQLNLIKKF